MWRRGTYYTTHHRVHYFKHTCIRSWAVVNRTPRYTPASPTKHLNPNVTIQVLSVHWKLDYFSFGMTQELSSSLSSPTDHDPTWQDHYRHRSTQSFLRINHPQEGQEKFFCQTIDWSVRLNAPIQRARLRSGLWRLVMLFRCPDTPLSQHPYPT